MTNKETNAKTVTINEEKKTMVFKKEKWLQRMNPEQKKTLAELCDGALDAPFLWWNKFNGVKVYPVEDTPGYYTDETGRYLFMEKWCEEEENEK